MSCFISGVSLLMVSYSIAVVICGWTWQGVSYQSQPLATVINENRKALFSFIGVFLFQQNFSRRKSRKNAYFSSQICTFASSKSERSLAIQNNVPQCTPLISKSLPIHLSLKGNTLLLNKIVRERKIHMD